ncbi:MAG: glycoside hydrolase family 2 TIM barrel-domain containing protein [Saprospiraceae bacterium]
MNTKQVLLFLVSLLQLAFLNEGKCQTKKYLSGKDAATAIDWEFKMSTGRNSGYWTSIPVPSNWETQGFGHYTYGNDPKDYETNPEIGNYRHQFKYDLLPGKRHFIVFQGAMTETKVTFNGQQVGEIHFGGFTEFKYEVTDYLKNGENTLEVEVRKPSTNPQVHQAERISDFWLFGGIFRPVFIEEVPANHIQRVAIDAQMDGSFQMDVYADVKEKGLRLVAQIYDASQQKVGKPFSTKVQAEKHHLASRLIDVQLWSHEMPNLYSVEVQLKSKKKVLHKYQQKFGFRTFEVRDHDGFYLNGKRILLKGANMHSFRPETGRCLSKEDMVENVRLMQDLNFNTVRICHYPPDTYLLDLCDSLGLLAMDELPGWRHPLPTDIGGKIVKELVVRDVNHPSVILWSNGNHLAHNPDFDEVFLKWDIQQRRPLKNETKTGDIYKNYDPDFDIVKTNFYPPYDVLQKRLFEEDHIVMPNEALHALYDGGGGANLKTYWKQIEASKVGGGLMIWALFDEGLLRTNMGNQPDNVGNRGPDGIVGPHGEKEGSYYAVREIWSPVVIKEDKIDVDFDGKLDVENKYTFLNLQQCRFNWKLVTFERPNTSASGYRTLASGKAISPAIEAGAKGTIQLSLPAGLSKYDALLIEVKDNKDLLVYEKRLLLEQEDAYFQTSKGLGFIQDKENPFLFYFGKTTLQFDPTNGILKKVAIEGKPTSVSNFPFIDVKSTDTTLVNDFSQRNRPIIRKEGAVFIIETKNTKGFDQLKWSLNPSGEIKLDYQYTLNQGAYDYAGIGMGVDANDVKHKRWLGEGPARIWKNRKEGGVWDVFSVDKKVNIPGEVYNTPAFEGCFAPWEWAAFYLENRVSIGFKNNSDLILGVLNPVNGFNPKFAQWQYPKAEGFYFFNTISAVGTKWKAPKTFGPDAQAELIQKPLTGSVSMYINWNHALTKTELYPISIE